MSNFTANAKQRRSQALRRQYDAARKDGPAVVSRMMEDFKEGLRTKAIRAEDFGIRALFESFVDDGYEAAQLYNPANGGSISITEAADAVSTTHFANITGQIVYSRVLDSFNDPKFLWPELFTTVPTELSGEKIAGIGRLGDDGDTVQEGGLYPLAGLSEEWIETPATVKRGLIVPVTKEAVFFDRVGLVLKRAGEVGRSIGFGKEKRCLDVALGITTTYRRNGGAAQATYGDTHTNGDFDNVAASNALVDWTDIEAAELLFDAMTDPNNGEPVDVMPDTIIVPTALKHTANRIVSATEIAYGPGGSTSNATVAKSKQPTGNQYRVLSSAYVKLRTSSASTWFIGEPKRAFVYMENWPITVQQAPPNSHDEFERDIVAKFKASERGVAAVEEPRRMVKCTG